MTEECITPLRRRMIEDMSVRHFASKIQHDYIRSVMKLTRFLGRSPDTATNEDLRRFQLHLTENRAGAPIINSTVSALRFFFTVTLDRADAARNEWLNADVMRVDVPLQPAYRPLDEILAAAKAAARPYGMPERLRMPRNSSRAAVVTFIVPSGEVDTDIYEIFVDPYTAKVTGQRLMMQGDRLLSQPFIRIIMVGAVIARAGDDGAETFDRGDEREAALFWVVLVEDKGVGLPAQRIEA